MDTTSQYTQIQFDSINKKNCPEVDDIFQWKILNLRTLQTMQSMQFCSTLLFTLPWYVCKALWCAFFLSYFSIFFDATMHVAIYKTNIKWTECASPKETYKHTQCDFSYSAQYNNSRVVCSELFKCVSVRLIWFLLCRLFAYMHFQWIEFCCYCLLSYFYICISRYGHVCTLQAKSDGSVYSVLIKKNRTPSPLMYLCFLSLSLISATFLYINKSFCCADVRCR